MKFNISIFILILTIFSLSFVLGLERKSESNYAKKHLKHLHKHRFQAEPAEPIPAHLPDIA